MRCHFSPDHKTKINFLDLNCILESLSSPDQLTTFLICTFFPHLVIEFSYSAYLLFILNKNGYEKISALNLLMCRFFCL